MKKLIFVLSLFLAQFTYGQEVFEFYNGVRALGMGGATVAVVNDETALLQNPAGLGKLRDYFFTLADPEIEVGNENQQIMGVNLLGMVDPQAVNNDLKDNPGKSIHTRAQVFPSIVLPNFGFGVFKKYELHGYMNAAGTEYDLQYFNDSAFIVGFNFRFLGGRLKLGFNAKVTNRIEIQEDNLDPTRTDLTLETLGKEGIGVGSDVGLIATLPWKFLPTLAIRARDVGDTKYDFKDGLFLNATSYPTKDVQKVDAALAIFPILGNRSRSVITLEVRDTLNMSTYEDKYKLYHAGVEFNFFDAFFIRGGMNQRYWTAGLELAMANYQLQFATYGEEVGTATANLESRRYVAKFAYRF